MGDGVVTHVRRDIGRDSKTTEDLGAFLENAQGVLDAIHDDMLSKCRAFRDENTVEGSSVADIEHFFGGDGTGFMKCPVAVLEDESLQAVMKKLSLTTRNIPFDGNDEIVLIAKAY